MLPDAFLEIPLAHRALHDATDGRPENSLAAIRAAVAGGYGIEIDLQLSADGQAMVFHDRELDRLTGARGKIRKRASDELGEIVLTGGTDTIPTLAQVLEEVGERVPLLIEIKDQSRVMGAGPDTLERAAAKALRDYGGPVAVMSFNPHAVAAFGALAPRVPRGLTTCGYDKKGWLLLGGKRRAALRGFADFVRTGASFVSHDWTDLGRAEVAALKAEGAPVLCWTTKSQADEDIARRIAHNVTFEGDRAPVDGR